MTPREHQTCGKRNEATQIKNALICMQIIKYLEDELLDSFRRMENFDFDCRPVAEQKQGCGVLLVGM